MVRDERIGRGKVDRKDSEFTLRNFDVYSDSVESGYKVDLVVKKVIGDI